MTTKRGPGRPVDPTSRRQGRRVSGRVSLAEYDELTAAAGDTPLWTWIIDAALERAGGLRRNEEYQALLCDGCGAPATVCLCDTLVMGDEG